MAGIIGSLAIYVLCFVLLFPCFLLLSEMWSQASPVITSQIGLNATDANQVAALGNTTFYYLPDSIIVIMYFGLIIALFISALYEVARPESFPIGILFLIPLILITFPMSDFTHGFYTNPGFANIVQYYPFTEYISDWSPAFTSLFTIAYLVFLLTSRSKFRGGEMPSGGNIISG